MDENIQSTPQTPPLPVQPVVPTPTPTKPKTGLFISLAIFVVLLSLGVAGFFEYQNYQLTHIPQLIITISPAPTGKPTKQCNTDQEYINSAVKPLSCQCPAGYTLTTLSTSWGPCLNPSMKDCLQTTVKCTKTNTSSTFSCPANGWTDCMPGPNAKPECSPAAMLWYRANCPNFKGAAL